MNRSDRARHVRLAMAALLGVMAISCFARVLGFGFVYDDHWTIVENRALERPLVSLLAAVFSGSHETAAIADSTRPTMVASVWIDRRLFGTNPAGYHAESLLWYALACIAAGFFVLSLTRKLRTAIAGGAFFALAPVHAEAVAAVNYREDLIAGLVALGVLAWLFASRTRPETTRNAVAWALAFLVGLLAKESAVAVVLVGAGIVLLRHPERAWFEARKKSLVAFAVVLVAWGTWRLSLRLRGVDDIPLAEPMTLATRLLATARYEVQVLCSSLAPITWSPEYATQGPPSPWWVLLLFGAIGGATLLCIERATRPAGLGFVVALLAALPSSPLVGPANERADRFVFLSVLGGALVWGFLAEQVLTKFAARRVLSTPFAVLLVCLPFSLPLAVLSQSAAKAWKDELTLWTVASERAPNSYRSFVGLSRALRLKGDFTGAETSIERALVLYPNSLSAHVTRAYLRLALGDVAGARADIQRVRDLGGGRQRGLKRAAQCAELPPERTRACVDGKP